MTAKSGREMSNVQFIEEKYAVARVFLATIAFVAYAFNLHPSFSMNFLWCKVQLQYLPIFTYYYVYLFTILVNIIVISQEI